MCPVFRSLLESRAKSLQPTALPITKTLGIISHNFADLFINEILISTVEAA